MLPVKPFYASLTRGATWKPGLIDLKNDAYAFTETYDVPIMPIWSFLAFFGRRWLSPAG